MPPRLQSAALTIAAVAIRTAISVPDWRLWQMFFGLMAIALAAAAVATNLRNDRPYRTLVVAGDWQEYADGYFLEIPATVHRKSFPTYAVFARRADGGRDDVVTGGDVLCDGTVRLEIVSRSEYEVEIR